MSSITGYDFDDVIPSPGTRKWWVAYFSGPIIVIALGLTLFPHLVYDRYIWQYLWGPVVADAASGPVTYQGISAVKGYNLVNTISYVTVMLYALPGVREFLDTFEITLDSQFAYGLAPILVAGGVMRALEDAGSLPSPLNLLFITPPIYFVIAALTMVALMVGVGLRSWFDSPWVVPAAPATLGALWSLGGMAVVIAYGLRLGGVLRPLVLMAAVGIALAFVGGLYGVSTWLDHPRLRHPLVLLLVFGQMLDAAQNLIGVTFFGYTPKLFITRLVYDTTNFSGSTFLLKLGAVGLIVWFVMTSEDDVEATWSWIILFVAIAVGLPQGVRGTLRIVLGV